MTFSDDGCKIWTVFRLYWQPWIAVDAKAKVKVKVKQQNLSRAVLEVEASTPALCVFRDVPCAWTPIKSPERLNWLTHNFISPQMWQQKKNIHN